MPILLHFNLRHSIRKIQFFVLFALVVSHFAFGQKAYIDSLKQTIGNYPIGSSITLADSSYIDALNDLGTSFRFKNNDSLQLLSIKALLFSEKVNYTDGIIDACTNLGAFYSDQGNSKQAINYFQKGLSLSQEHSNESNTAALLNDLASEYSYQGNYAKALENFLIGLDIAKASDDKLLSSILNENIANLYASQKEFDQALDFYKVVKKLNQEIGNETVSAETMSNIASVYADMGKFDRAMFNINSSITVFENNEIFDWLAFAYGVKGEIYLLQKKYDWAVYWYKQSGILHEKLQDDRGTIDLYNGLANAYLGQGKDELAKQNALKGFEISKNINSLEGQINCAETLYQVYKNNKLFDKALKYHEVFQKLGDSLSRDENKRSLTLLKTKMNYDQQKHDLIDQNEKSLARQRYIIWFVLVIIFILLATAIPLYINQKKQQKLNRELKYKTKNLRDRESQLNEINRTKDKLFSIIGHDLRSPIGALQGILRFYTSGEIKKDDFLSFVPKLKTDVDHILFTLNNLLSWGYAQMNGTTTRPKVVGLNQIVENNIRLLQEVANKKNIKIMNQLAEDDLGLVDEDHFDIVLRNLISNAIKFTKENGLITIERKEQKEYWQIMVKDTGIGMTKAVQEKVFKNETNFTSYGTNNEKGTGLGLALCKEMVEKNKGTIWVESTPQEGSVFHFTIPKVIKNYQKAG